MEKYSYEHREIINAAIKHLNEAMAEVALAANVSEETILRDVKLHIVQKKFTLLNSNNPFNAFLKKFKEGYAQNKEVLKAQYPGLTFIE
ncbi:unnamed protein product [Mucor hiemalis]